MREILFRGKPEPKYGTGWCYGGGLYTDYEGDCILATDISKRVVIKDTVGQYTGLTDKNGVKIFEGDIIRYTTKERSSIYGVCWNAEAACFVVYGSALGKGKPIGDFTFFDSQKCEVIGNIFDNPELLKGGESNG